MTEVRTHDITAVFKGLTTPVHELTRQIEWQGWHVDSLDTGKNGYHAKASNDHGDKLERYAPDDRTALANLLIAIVRRNFMRVKSKVSAWSDMSHWHDVAAVAMAYSEAPVYDPAAIGGFKELADDSVRRFAVLQQQLDIEVVDDPEPYGSPQEMCADIHEKQKFKVSRANCDHPVWTVDQNVAFRAVHDVLGHCVAGGNFDFGGELQACSAHFPLLGPEAQKALATECIGQTGYAAYYRGFGPQKVAYLDELIEAAMKDNNDPAHSGIHPSQSLAPTQSPAIPQPEYEKYGLPKGTPRPDQSQVGMLPTPPARLDQLNYKPTYSAAQAEVVMSDDGGSFYDNADWNVPSHKGQRPTIYEPFLNKVFVGAEGQHHFDLVREHNLIYDEPEGEDETDEAAYEWSSQNIGDVTSPIGDLAYGMITERGGYHQWGPDENHAAAKAGLTAKGLINDQVTETKPDEWSFFGKTAGGEVIDPNWKYQTGIEPHPDYHAQLHYGDPLEHDKVKDTASLIDTGWSAKDPNDPGERAVMKQAIVNAFRVVLLSPRKDLRWNAAHYQDISHVPAEVDDPKHYWDALEHQRRTHNVARGRHPDAHLIYFKPREKYYQMVNQMHPNLSHEESIKKADEEIWKMRVHTEHQMEMEEEEKEPSKRKSSDELDRRVNESIAKQLKAITDAKFKPETDAPTEEHEQLGLLSKTADMEPGQNPEHRPNYKPGAWGKGILFRNGDVHTWNTRSDTVDEQGYEYTDRDGIPFHNQYLSDLRAETGRYESSNDKPEQFFQITPEGKATVSPQYMEHVNAAHPDLTVADDDWWKFAAKGQRDIFTGEDAEFYGAFMGTHLKSIAQISRHSDELLEAAIQDVQGHDGTGYHFRASVLKLGVPGVGPKVCSFAWLLLQPMTSQLATIDTHMMDVLGHDYDKEMNNRDYFKFERELQAGRDASGYGHVPLGQFQWGMWDYKRTGPGSHQDHSAMRVLDPVPHAAIDWAGKANNLKGDSWLKQAPEWWQATQPARDQVAQHFDANIATQVARGNVPFQTVPTDPGVLSKTATLPGEYGAHNFKYWWDKEKPLYGDESRIIADYAAVTKMTRSKLKDWIEDHRDDIRGDYSQFKKRCLDRFEVAHRESKTADTEQPIPVIYASNVAYIGTLGGHHYDIKLPPNVGGYESIFGLIHDGNQLELFTGYHSDAWKAIEDKYGQPLLPYEEAEFYHSKTADAAFVQSIPWLTDQSTGAKIPGKPGQSLMHHLKGHHGLSTKEIWALPIPDDHVGKH